MPRLFGTDGVRGLANADLTPALALSLATSAARILTSAPWHESMDRARAGGLAASARRAATQLDQVGGGAGTDPEATGSAGTPRLGDRPFAVLGRDPRASGEMLEAAVAAGLASAGVDVLQLGVLPTPAVAFLTADLGADLGIVISASHNAMPDNGIKIFGPGGRKLSDEAEDAIEAGMADVSGLPTGEGVGRIRPMPEAARRYTDHLLIGTPHALSGLRVVVDCANGAASAVAPEAYRRAGAEVVVIAGSPDGWNINAGVGSTHIDCLRQAVIDHGADLGIAHDGDADRCLAVAADGTLVDGDAILALLAMALRERNELSGNAVVTTVMANIGFHRAMAKAGIAVRTSAVGDRYVLAEMQSGGYTLGGEQSGHIILSSMATTGDGLLTALNLMAIVAATGRPLAELAADIPHFPQVLINVEVVDKAAAVASDVVRTAVAEAEAELGDAGRVLLRPSGTEPLIRVMVEAADEDDARRIAGRVAAAVTQSATTGFGHAAAI
jgi:phosphoglucosamine mutase